jgi:hypothetical protein
VLTIESGEARLIAVEQGHLWINWVQRIEILAKWILAGEFSVVAVKTSAG